MRSWFYRILVRECLSFLRQNRRVIYLAEPPEQVQSSGESALEDREALRQAIDRLSPKLKTVVLLRFYEEMQLSEIAEITGTNLSTVKSRLYKGLKKLRESLQEDDMTEKQDRFSRAMEHCRREYRDTPFPRSWSRGWRTR